MLTITRDTCMLLTLLGQWWYLLKIDYGYVKPEMTKVAPPGDVMGSAFTRMMPSFVRFLRTRPYEFQPKQSAPNSEMQWNGTTSTIIKVSLRSRTFPQQLRSGWYLSGVVGQQAAVAFKGQKHFAFIKAFLNQDTEELRYCGNMVVKENEWAEHSPTLFIPLWNFTYRFIPQSRWLLFILQSILWCCEVRVRIIHPADLISV